MSERNKEEQRRFFSFFACAMGDRETAKNFARSAPPPSTLSFVLLLLPAVGTSSPLPLSHAKTERERKAEAPVTERERERRETERGHRREKKKRTTKTVHAQSPRRSSRCRTRCRCRRRSGAAGTTFRRPSRRSGGAASFLREGIDDRWGHEFCFSSTRKTRASLAPFQLFYTSAKRASGLPTLKR